MENYKKCVEYKEYIKPLLKKINISKIQKLSDNKYALIKNNLLYGTMDFNANNTIVDITYSNKNHMAYKMDLIINKNVDNELDVSFFVLSIKNGGENKFVDSSYEVSNNKTQGRISSSYKNNFYIDMPFDSCRGNCRSLDDEITYSYMDTINKTLKLVDFKK